MQPLALSNLHPPALTVFMIQQLCNQTFIAGYFHIIVKSPCFPDIVFSNTPSIYASQDLLKTFTWKRHKIAPFVTALFNKNVTWKSIWHQFIRIRTTSSAHFVITILLKNGIWKGNLKMFRIIKGQIYSQFMSLKFF